MISADVAANCPPAVRPTQQLESRIETGADFTPPLLTVHNPKGHVEAYDNEDPSKHLFDPVELRAVGGRVVGYAALDKKSRIEVLCASDAEVQGYIGSRVVESLNPHATTITVHVSPEGDSLVGKNGYEYASVLSQPGGVGISSAVTGPGGLGPVQSGGLGPAPETGSGGVSPTS